MKGKEILAPPIVLMLLLSSAVIAAPAVSAEDEGLPSSFDQRDLGIVTPPKYQDPWGVCWAFGGISAAETSILSMQGTTWEESGLDLSERHASFFSNNYIDENVWPSQAGEGIHFFGDDPNSPFSGAMPTHFSQLFSSGAGPLYEGYYPYKGKDSLDCLQMLNDPDSSETVLNRLFFGIRGYSIEEIIALCNEELRESLFSYWTDYLGVTFPEGVNAANFTAADIIPTMMAYATELYSEKNQYSMDDDWSIDRSERNYTIGFTMMDGNYMKDTRLLDSGTYLGVDWDAVRDMKSELYQGHGMVLGLCLLNESYNPAYGAAYECRWTWPNHMVQVVGWDDDYPAGNFTWTEGSTEHTPEGNGAWLCKNSWGSETYGYEINGNTYYSDWGIPDGDGKATGFFWVSYYDRTVQFAESLSFTDRLAAEDGMIYLCYDYLPDSYLRSWTDDDVIKTANIFDTYRGKLNAVSVRTFGYDSDVTVKVYLNVRDSPESGILIFKEERNIPYAGIHVLYLDEQMPVRDGQLVSVVVEERSGERYVFGASSTDGEELARSAGSNCYGVAVINEGESFLYRNGAWTDWSVTVAEYLKDDPGKVYDNFSIKVFEVTMTHEETDHTYGGTLAVIIALGAVAMMFVNRKR